MAWVAVGTTAAGLLAGKMKNDRAKAVESSDRKLAAETQRYSPWTGMTAGPIRNAGSGWGDMLGGATQGYSFGAGIQNGMKKATELDGTEKLGGIDANLDKKYMPNQTGNGWQQS